MNIDEHVKASLKFLDFDAGILGEVLFIGAWARYFYRDFFKGSKVYHARLMTKDLDVLIDRKKLHQKRQTDVHQKLLDAGFRAQFFSSNVIKYHRDELELEFLMAARGEGSDKAVHVEAYNVTAQELPFLKMLWRNPVSLRYGKYRVKVPHPMDFAVHKLIISGRRKNKASAEQDRRDAEEVLDALHSISGFEKKFRESVEASKLSRKTFAMVDKGISLFLLPTLRDDLQGMLRNLAPPLRHSTKD